MPSSAQDTVEPKRAVIAPKYGPRIMPNIEAISAARLITIGPTPMGTPMVVVIIEITTYRAANIAIAAICFVVIIFRGMFTFLLLHVNLCIVM